jgi:hypothetical protein
MREATLDEADRYIASLMEGTDYAKRKDHEARLRRMYTRCLSVPDSCQPPRPAGAHAAESHTPAPALNDSQG